jgi:uncharacterized membrane-anchored protein
MNPQQVENPVYGLIFFFVMMILLALISHMLAKQKGRNVVLWTILGLIPGINMICIYYFVGATNLTLEKKIDKLLRSQKSE